MVLNETWLKHFLIRIGIGASFEELWNMEDEDKTKGQLINELVQDP